MTLETAIRAILAADDNARAMADYRAHSDFEELRRAINAAREALHQAPAGALSLA